MKGFILILLTTIILTGCETGAPKNSKFFGERERNMMTHVKDGRVSLSKYPSGEVYTELMVRYPQVEHEQQFNELISLIKIASKKAEWIKEQSFDEITEGKRKVFATYSLHFDDELNLEELLRKMKMNGFLKKNGQINEVRLNNVLQLGVFFVEGETLKYSFMEQEPLRNRYL